MTKIKGLWPHPGQEEAMLGSLDEIKSWGVNILPVTVSFCVKGASIEPDFYGPLWQKWQAEKIFTDRIDKIHRAGLAVSLELGTLNPRCETEIQNKDYFISHFSTYVQKWAKIAEEHQVEFFSPLNEPNFALKGRETEFAQKVLPLVKQTYTGNVVLKVADIGPENIDYSGYDYAAFDIYPGDLTGWSEQLQMVLSQAQKIKRAYQLKGVFLGEVGALTNRDPNDPLLAGNVFSEQEQAEIFETAFQTLWDKLSGFFVMSWSKNPSDTYNIRGKPAEQVIKKWFKRGGDNG